MTDRSEQKHGPRRHSGFMKVKLFPDPLSNFGSIRISRKCDVQFPTLELDRVAARSAQ